MSKIIQRKCRNGYRHHFVRADLSWDNPDSTGAVMRELLLVCARCDYHLWIDSIVRPYFGIKSDDDWGT